MLTSARETRARSIPTSGSLDTGIHVHPSLFVHMQQQVNGEPLAQI